MKKPIYKLIIIFITFGFYLNAQSDTTTKVTVSGYGEIYYGYDFDQPSNHIRPPFIYNHKRNNEFNLNLGLLKLSATNPNYRANLAAMVGTYAQYNLAAESIWAQHIYEANAGFRLSPKGNLWIDVGIMPSHIGFETAVGIDCWMLTRSIVAENSPYYETGLKLSGSNNRNTWSYALLLLNGWQTTFRADGSNFLSAGSQITYKPSETTLFNYSNFYGNIGPDSIKSTRQYHNFFLTTQLSKKVFYTIGVDLGFQKNNKTIPNDFWLTPQVVIKYQANAKHTLAYRLESIYNDGNVIQLGNSSATNLLGNAINWDITLNKMMTFRMEAKHFMADQGIFYGDKTNAAVTMALAIKI